MYPRDSETKMWCFRFKKNWFQLLQAISIPHDIIVAGRKTLGCFMLQFFANFLVSFSGCFLEPATSGCQKSTSIFWDVKGAPELLLHCFLAIFCLSVFDLLLVKYLNYYHNKNKKIYCKPPTESDTGSPSSIAHTQSLVTCLWQRPVTPRKPLRNKAKLLEKRRFQSLPSQSQNS